VPRLRRLALAAGAGAGIIVWAAVADLARGFLRELVPSHYAAAVTALVAGAILIALAAGLARIRTEVRNGAPARGALSPLQRYLLLLLAIGTGILYARMSSTGSPEVDAVERFHFVQYGLLTWLFYRAWLPAGDRSVLIAPALAGMLVGTLDEWCQWLIPYRVGEAHDVFLNGAAIACGLLFSVAIEPPSPSRGMRQGSRVWLFGLAAAAWLAFALFFNSVQVGYEVRTADGGRFLSTLSRSELMEAAVDRAARWRGMDSPQLARRFSIEDRYLSEGLWHVQHRNQKFGEEKPAAAWSENRILEEFYAPVLDRPISGSPSGSRWPPNHPAASAASRTGVYVSTANPFPLYPWPKWIFWALAIGGTAALAGVGIIRR
jgi:hypothetical protein